MRKTTARKPSSRMAKKVEDLAPTTRAARKVKGGIEWTYRDPASLATKAGGEVLPGDFIARAR
jgi:hypothetical protein